MDSRLQEILADVFGVKPDSIRPELGKDDIDSWDSLKQMDLVMSLEKAYDISLEMEDIIRMTNVAAIMAVLAAKGVKLEN